MNITQTLAQCTNQFERGNVHAMVRLAEKEKLPPFRKYKITVRLPDGSGIEHTLERRNGDEARDIVREYCQHEGIKYLALETVCID